MNQNEDCKQRARELLEQMTLHEKVGQLQQVAPSPVGGFEVSPEELGAMYQAGKISEKEYEILRKGGSLDLHDQEIRRGEIGSFISVMDPKTANRLQRIAVEESRLGIPLIFGLDVIHGFKTVFPIPLAESCTFDEELFEETAQAAAGEAGEYGIHWTYAPMVDIARDARWGRIAEGAGEDPYLASRYGAAKVRGFQGEDISQRGRIAACVKHFAAYGACEGGRDYDTVDMSLPMFYETYLPPYAAAVKAGCASVMAAFNDLGGIPCTTSQFLLRRVLRERLGFEGMVISDANAIKECVNHGTALDEREAVKQAIEAGTQMDLGSNLYTAHLEELVEQGEVDVKYLDEAVFHVLKLKLELGLFEHPYVEEQGESLILCPKHRQLARRAARKAIVLLKNDGGILPLAREEKVAVVGAVADNRAAMLGCWAFTGEEKDTATLVAALRERQADFVFEPCCSENEALDQSRLRAVAEDDRLVVAALEYGRSGEAESCCDLSLSENQLAMLRELKKAGKRIVALLFNGRPIETGEIVELADAVLEVWHLGTEAGRAIADVLYGDYNPSGRLSVTFPNRTGECPVYYNHPSTGRPRDESNFTSKYRDAPLTPAFPFGYGLSYTTYEYGPIHLESRDEGLMARVTVTNTGNVPGEETVQLYVHRRRAGRVRPVRELKGYQKVFLKPGESREVSIFVPRESLGFYDMEGNYCLEGSEFDVWMAHDSSGGSWGRLWIG